MKKFLLITLCVFLYLASSVPVGLFIYSLKMDLGLDIFSRTGFHGFLYCLKSEGEKAMSSDDE